MTGLVIGKFCPLHLGHDYLIQHALSNSSHVTIVICGSQRHIHSLDTRLQWLSLAYPQARLVGLNQDGFDSTREEEWVKEIHRLVGVLPDVYYTSETHGGHYAQLLGISHKIVDSNREVVPISATQINANPAGLAHFLHPVVRL